MIFTIFIRLKISAVESPFFLKFALALNMQLTQSYDEKQQQEQSG